MLKIFKKISSKITNFKEQYTCFDIKKEFKNEARLIAQTLGIRKLDCKTIRAIYHELNRKDLIVRMLEENEANFEDVKEIILEHNYKNHHYKELLEAHGKSVKEQLGLNVQDILKLNLENRHIDKIISRLVESKKKSKKQKNNRQVTLGELRTLYFVKNQNLEILKSYVKAKKDVKDIAPELFIKAVFSGINPDALADVKRILQQNSLRIPDGILIGLFDEHVNILKTIKILAEAKQDSVQTVKDLFPIFDEDAADKFANDYTIEGKNKLKKSITGTVLKMNVLQDPAEIYLTLVRSEGKGFKINLETINDYILYDYTPNIDNISEVYEYARNSGLKIDYAHLAKLADKDVDIQAFVEAEINSRKT